MADTTDPKASEVESRWFNASRALAHDRRNDQLNRLFYMGYQWAWYDRASEIVRLNTDLADTRRARVTVNQIAPRFNSLLGRLTGKPLTFENRPTAGDDVTVRGARLAEMIVEDARRETGWESVRAETIFNVITGGTAAILVEIDDTDADGEDDELGQRKDTDEIVGHTPVRLAPFSISEFSLEPGTRRWRDSRWVICESLIPPEQARDYYGLSKTPDPARYATGHNELAGWLTTSRGSTNTTPLTGVLTMYERPNESRPEGVVRTVIGGEVVDETEWPFPFDYLNCYVFRCAELPFRWNGWTFLNSARPMQVHYNMLRSTLLEHAKMTSNARLMVPRGSLNDQTVLTDEAGEIVEYDADMAGGQRPFYLEPPSIARWLHEETVRLTEEMDNIMHTHSVTRGETPGERASGLALSIVAEKDDTPLGVIARDQSDGWAWLAGMVTQIIEDRQTGKAQATIEQDYGPPITVDYVGADLRGQHRFHVPMESTLPISRAALHAQMVDLKTAYPELFAEMDQEKLVQLLELPGGHSLVEQLKDDNVARAQRENNEMMAGNPQPVERWHDHAKDIRQHNRLRNSSMYANAPEEWRQMVDEHIAAHEALAMEEVAKQMQANQRFPGAAAVPQANEPMGAFAPDPMMTPGGL